MSRRRVVRWADEFGQSFFADTRRSLVAVALLVALPAIVLGEVTARAGTDQIRADAERHTIAAAREIASRQGDRIAGLAQEVVEVAAGPALAAWSARGDAPSHSATMRTFGSDVIGLLLVDRNGKVISSEPAGIEAEIAPELLGPWDRVLPPLVSRIHARSNELPPHLAISVQVLADPEPQTLIAIADAGRVFRWTTGLLSVFEDVYVVDDSGIGLSAARIRLGGSALIDVRSIPAVPDGARVGTVDASGTPRMHASAPVVGTSQRILVTESMADTAAEVASITTSFRVLVGFLLALVFASSVMLSRRLRRIARQRERLARVQELAHVGGWEWDIWGDRISVSAEVLRIYGLGRGEGGTTYRSVLERVHPDDRERVEAELLRALRDHAELSVTHRIVRPDGAVRIVETRGTPVGVPGRATSMWGTAQDVTEFVRREEEHDRLMALVDSAGEALVTSTLDGTITSWNRGAERMLGYTAAEAVGRSMQELRPADRRGRPIRLLDRVRAGERVVDHETERVRKDGSTVTVALAVAPMHDVAGAVVGAAWSFRDIGAIKSAEAELAHRASHDALTDLPNRFLLEDRLDQAIRASQRSGRPLAVMTIDLHRFRDINDAFGHSTGDLALVEVAKRLSKQGRAVDTVARLGSDKFGLVVPETDQDAAVLVASRLRSDLQRPIEIAGKELSLDVNVGTALYPLHGEDVRTVLRRSAHAADVARTQLAGTAVYRYEIDGDAEDRATVVGELRRAIEQDELVVHFQPLVNLASGLILGVEALVRWEHPTRGLIPPGQFVPLAEQSTLMSGITRTVLTKALRQYRRWHEAGHALPVLVNISPRDLRDPGFVPMIEALHDTYRVSPKWLKLEITEGFVVDDPERAIVTLRRMRELGILIALDDFGTGYSSLSYLARLPVDAVKVDRSFVATMRSEPRTEAIVRATIGLAHTLGFGTVAEGVEDDETLRLLKEMGSDMAQGYHIARPMPAHELDVWLRTASWRPRPAPVDDAARAWTRATAIRDGVAAD